jgi:hypothetical protein
MQQRHVRTPCRRCPESADRVHPDRIQRSLQIVDTESNDRDPWLHRPTKTPRWRTMTKKFATGYVSQRKVSTSGS